MKNRITSFLPSFTFSSPLLPFLTFLLIFCATQVATAQIPSNGLVGYWPFNGNANDESGNGNNGTVNGPTLTTDRFGNANSAYSFGAGNVLIPLTQQMVSMPERTISLWFRSTSNQGGGRLFEATNVSWGAACYNSNNIDCWYQKSNQAYNIVQQTFPSNNIWYNLVYTCDSTNQTKKLYLNGVLINSGAPVSNPGNPTAWINHFLKIGQGLANESFAGQIDDIAIYGRSLTSAEIEQIYTSQTSTVQPPCPTLATNLQTGLVGYWPFCGNANDESGNGNNGTVNGATLTTDRFGNANSAYSFDGVDDFIAVSDNDVLDLTNNFSISAWLRPNSFGIVNMIISKHNVSGGVNSGTYAMGLWNVNGNSLVNFQASPNFNEFTYPSADGTVQINQWKNFTVTYEKNINTLKYYLDGVLIFTTSIQFNILNTNEIFRIGANYNNGVLNLFSGVLDDISIYNRALTPAEISQLYTNPSTTPPVACTTFLGEDQTVCAGTSVTLSASGSTLACPTLPATLQNGLVGYWPFCGNANDASGNGNNGTVNGATLTTDRFGNANSAYNFDGNDFIRVADNNALDVTQNLSISAWMKSSSLSSNQGVLGKGKLANSTGYALLHNVSSPNQTGISIQNAPIPASESFINSSLITYGSWSHLVGTYNGSQLKFYLNGSLVSTVNTSLQLAQNSTADFYIGCELLNFRFFMGQIDDAMIHNRALSAAEIQQLYTLGQSTYLWSTGATTASINVTPTTTTTYTCTVTDANGNVCTDSVTVFVPQIEATDLTICAGETTTLSVSGINSTATPSACPTLPTNLQNGLVGYWPFCGNANDASGNGNNGTVNGATLTTDRFGNFNTAYSFNGTSNKIVVPDANTIDFTNNYSFGGWYNTNNTLQLDQTILGKGNPGGGTGYQLTVNTNTVPRKLQFGYNSGPGTNPVNGGANTPVSNSNLSGWHYLAGTYDGTNAKLYLDGVLMDSNTITYTLQNSTQSLLFGSETNNLGRFFNGSLDDIGLWNRSLSSSEIQQLYTLGQTTYLWSNGATTPTINVSPTSTTTYTCTVTTNGVSCTDAVTVVVSNPVIDLGADVTVCGTSTTLTAPAGYDSYLWSNGGTTNTTTVTANGTYSCAVTQGGCSATDAVDVTLVNATVSASDSTICAGQSLTLSVPQGGSISTACAALPTNLQTGLVGYWPFCGNANDASGNGNNGTVNGATLTTDRFGNANNSYSFNGISSLIDLGNSSTYNLQNQISISVWIYMNGGIQNPRILQFGNNNIDEFGIETQGTSNTSRLVNGYFGGFPANATLTALAWHHVTYVANRSIGTSSIYFDGQLAGQNNGNPGATINYDACNFIIGNKPCNNSDFWGGKIDDVGLFNRTLSASEIQQLYTLGQTTYLWSNGATTPTINVSPTTTTTYTCTVTTNGVSCTDDVTVVVSQPVASITPNGIVEICQGQSIALTANGGVSYLWNTGAPTQSITVNTEAVYTVTVTDANGCTDNESQLVKVNFLPNIGVNNASVCPGQSTTLTATGALSYVWSPATGLSSTTGTTVTASPSTSTVYTVTGTGANGCTNTATAAVAVNAALTATITPATATTFCQGGSVVLNANTGTGLSYQWYNNASAISGATSASYTANASGSYTVVVTNASTCSATSTATVVTVNALPTATITPATATTFCQGGSVVLNANTGTGLSYQWYNNASAISGATSASYTANASGSYTVVVTNTSTCSATSTATVVSVNTLPTATITPATATTFCQGGSVVLNANTGTGLTYQWRLNGTIITGATSTSYTANASGSYTVVVTNASACSSTSAATTVTVNALPAATITPATATTFCQGGSVVLNANTGTGLTYQWYNNASAISGATSASYTANASGSYTVVVTNASTCSATSTATVVTVNALPTATITASSATTFCQGGSVVLTANTGTGLTYQWRLNGTNITGATSSSYTANMSGSYTVVVTNTSTCSATSTATVVTVNALPTATITASSATTFCQGGSVVLTANTGTGLTYQWRLNGTNIIGATSSSYTANASGSYTVVVTNASTCSATSTATVVTVNTLPTATITPATATTFCQGGSVVLNANTGTGLTYQWRLNGTNITGATSASYTANASGSYTVVVTNTSTCSATSTATVVTVNALPTATITASSATTFCQGGSVVLNANTGTGLSYQWYNNASAISGATSASYTANASGSYTVVVTNASTCSATSTATVVTVVPNVDYFADADGDGFGDPATLVSTCIQPQGYVTDNTDCDDTSADVNPAVAELCNHIDDDCSGTIDDGLIFNTYYADADGDTYGDANNSIYECSQPDGYVTNNTDCNDNNANQNAASAEICNGEDDDCDGAIDNGLVFLDYYADLDSDGFGAGVATNSCVDLGAGYVTNNSDCNNANALINPNATEICNDIDDNCDGQIDEGIVFTTYYQDFDNDGFGTGDPVTSCTNPGAGWVTNNTDCDDTNGNTNPNATETCNTIDDNCDGQIDEGVQTVYFIDNDGDTYGNPSVSILACTQPAGYTPDDTDCNDTDANINPGAEDIAGNGIDENCDGQIDNSIFELNATISLYPNPTRSELNIQVNSSIIGNDLYIFDAVGKLVHKQQLLSTQTTLPVSNFADGNYVVRVGEVVKRFEVIK